MPQIAGAIPSVLDVGGAGALGPFPAYARAGCNS